MAPLKVTLNIKKISVKNKQQKNISLLSSTMRRDYTLEHFPYGTHHRDV